MRYLVASGVDLSAQNDLGLTPLHYGSGLNHLIVIRNMSMFGEKRNRPFSELEAVRDGQNRTTRDVAESKGETHKHMVRLIDNNITREQNAKRLARWFPFLGSKRNQNIFLFFTPFMICASRMPLSICKFRTRTLTVTLRSRISISGPLCLRNRDSCHHSCSISNARKHAKG
jgi:hypothetical protein